MPFLPKRLAEFGRELLWFPLSSTDSSKFSEPLNEGRLPSKEEGAEDIVDGRSAEDEKKKGGKSSSVSSTSQKRNRRRVSDAINFLRRQRSKSSLRRHSQSTFYVSKEEEDTVWDDKEEESNQGRTDFDLVGDSVEEKTEEIISLLTEINYNETRDVNQSHCYGAQSTDCYENNLPGAVDSEARTTYTKCICPKLRQSCPNFLINTVQPRVCSKPKYLQPRRHSLVFNDGKDAKKLVKNSENEIRIHLGDKTNVVLKEGDWNPLQIFFTCETKWTQSAAFLPSENIELKPKNISLASFLECETHDKRVLDSHSNVTKFNSAKTDIINRSIVGSANCESGVIPSHSGVDKSCSSFLSSHRLTWSSLASVQEDHQEANKRREEDLLHSLNQTMDSVPLRDYFYCRSQSTDSAVIITAKTPPSSSSSCSASEETRLSSEKKIQKCNNVMSKIKRFARSQSQTRKDSITSQTPSPPSPLTSPSILASSHLIANNHHHLTESNTTLVSKTMDFYKDVKKRFSYQNTSTNDKEAEKYEDKVDGCSQGNLHKDLFQIPSANSSSSSDSGSFSAPVILPDSVEPIIIRPRIRRFASDESLPSDSGCGSSIRTGSLSTDSNRSSICTIEDVNSSGVLFRGPFIGQARAVLDCTPCPYDKDALAFKKGDIVNIIAKNDSGTWIGMANGKIGHFKFISVEESQSVNKLSRFSWRIRPKCSTITSNNTTGSSASSCEHRTITVANTKPDGESFESNTDIEHILESVKYLISTQPELKIQKLLEEVLDLKEESLYSKALAENGFSTLRSLKSLESPCTLKSCGINNSGHQNLILYVAKMVRESMEKELNVGKEEADAEDGDGQESDADHFDSIESYLLPKKVQRRRRRHTLDYFKFVQSAPVTPGIEFNEDSKCDWFQNCGTNLNLDKKMQKIEDNEYLYRRREHRKEGPSEEREDNKENPLREMKQFKEGSSNSRPINSAKPSPLPKSTALNNASLVQNLNKKVFHTRRSSKPKPSITSSKSLFDLRPSSQNSANNNCGNNNTRLIQESHHCYSNTTRRIRKFLHTERKSIHGPSPPNISANNSFPKRYNSISSLPTNTKPISELLIDNLTHRLKSDSIDLTTEPYSDPSGFCGTPPALVQRYAEELERDVYEVADALDHIRLCCLKQKGRAGIPNDFLGDSCSGPLVEQAIYDNLSSWFISIGLPMYEAAFREKGIRDLVDISRVRESELQSFGVIQPSHQRALSNAICALSIYVRKDDKT